MNINANDGNDFINFAFDSLSNNQLDNMVAMGRDHAVSIDGGSGNDIVKSWGNGVVDVNGGSGNDVIYVGQLADGSVLADGSTNITENRFVEHNAVFVFNSGNGNLGKMIYFDDAKGAQPLDNDILGSGANSYTLAKTAADEAITATVEFLGYSVNVELVGASATGATTLTYDELYRKIADAVVNDQTMNSLLAFKDGAGNSMIVETLIDGVYATGGTTAPTITFSNMASGITPSDFEAENASSPYLQENATVQTSLGDAGNRAAYQIANPFESIGNIDQNSAYALKVDGTMYYLQTALAGTTSADLATAMNAGLRDINGNYLTGYTFVDNSTFNGVAIEATSAGLQTGHSFELYMLGGGTGGAGALTGTSNGTASLNWVDPGVGLISDYNTIVLNVAADTAKAPYHDVLDLNGVFGHIDLVNFDGTTDNAAVAAVDKISVGDLLSLSATNAFTANGALNTANVAAAVVNNTGFAHAAANTTSYYTVAEFIDQYDAIYNAATAGIHNVIFIADRTDTTRYTVFQVDTDNNATLNASEVKLLGTIDFDDLHAGTASIDYADLIA